MLEPGDFVRIKPHAWSHNNGRVGMVCDTKDPKNIAVVFEVNPNSKTGKGEVWVYPQEQLEIILQKD